MKEQLNTLETQGNPAPVSSASIGALQVCMKVTVNAVMIFEQSEGAAEHIRNAGQSGTSLQCKYWSTTGMYEGYSKCSYDI